MEGSRPLFPAALCCVSQCTNVNVIPGSVEAAGSAWSGLGSKAPSVTGWETGGEGEAGTG